MSRLHRSAAPENTRLCDMLYCSTDRRRFTSLSCHVCPQTLGIFHKKSGVPFGDSTFLFFTFLSGCQTAADNGSLLCIHFHLMKLLFLFVLFFTIFRRLSPGFLLPHFLIIIVCFSSNLSLSGSSICRLKQDSEVYKPNPRIFVRNIRGFGVIMYNNVEAAPGRTSIINIRKCGRA